MRVNKRAVEDLDKQPKPAVRDLHWDDKLAGFGLRRTPLGKISYVLKYRVRGDKTQRFETLGDWPATAPDDARQNAMDLRSAAAQGRDLIAERKAAAEADRAAAAEFARRAVPLTELLDGWREVTKAELAKRLEAEQTGVYEKELLRIEARILRPAIGDATVGNFSTTTFQTLILNQTSRTAGGMLRAMVLRFTAYVAKEMERRHMTLEWPERYKVTGKAGRRWERYTLDQMAAIWIACGELGRRGALVRMMLLTGSRASEAVRIREPRIFLEHDVLGPHWLQRAGTTKNREEHRVPLSPPAVAMLEWLPMRSTKTTPSTSLIFSGRGGKLVSSWSEIKSTLLRLAGIEDGQLHDFRRSIVSTLGDHGVDIHVADGLLNHKASATKPGVMAVYQHSEQWRQRIHALNLWADLLFAAIEKRLGAPVSRETWGFDAPFVEIRVKRTDRIQPAPAPRRRGRPPRSISAASQASKADRV